MASSTSHQFPEEYPAYPSLFQQQIVLDFNLNPTKSFPSPASSGVRICYRIYKHGPSVRPVEAIIKPSETTLSYQIEGKISGYFNGSGITMKTLAHMTAIAPLQANCQRENIESPLTIEKIIGIETLT